MQILNKIYQIYKEDLQTEDNPPNNPNLNFNTGDVIELRGNIYIYLWKETENGYYGLLATPYTLLTHPLHPRVKTDGLLYEVMSITDIPIPLTKETIKKYLTDVLHITAPQKEELNTKIENSIKRKKIYHPIREKFLRDEIRRTAFLIEEYLESIEEVTPSNIVIKLPSNVLNHTEFPQRLAAASEQKTAENDYFLIVEQGENIYSLLLKNPNILGKKVKILLGNTLIFEGILDAETLIIETDKKVPITFLADLLKLEE